MTSQMYQTTMQLNLVDFSFHFRFPNIQNVIVPMMELPKDLHLIEKLKKMGNFCFLSLELSNVSWLSIKMNTRKHMEAKFFPPDPFTLWSNENWMNLYLWFHKFVKMKWTTAKRNVYNQDSELTTNKMRQKLYDYAVIVLNSATNDDGWQIRYTFQ